MAPAFGCRGRGDSFAPKQRPRHATAGNVAAAMESSGPFHQVSLSCPWKIRSAAHRSRRNHAASHGIQTLKKLIKNASHAVLRGPGARTSASDWGKSAWCERFPGSGHGRSVAHQGRRVWRIGTPPVRRSQSLAAQCAVTIARPEPGPSASHRIDQFRAHGFSARPRSRTGQHGPEAQEASADFLEERSRSSREVHAGSGAPPRSRSPPRAPISRFAISIATATKPSR